jgi:hypothetical protein
LRPLGSIRAPSCVAIFDDRPRCAELHESGEQQYSGAKVAELVIEALGI